MHVIFFYKALTYIRKRSLYIAIVPVHENGILIAYAIIPEVISIILPLITKMFSDIFSLAI